MKVMRIHLKSKLD